MYKIVHLTSAHQRYDTRIFHKMCSSLAAKGYKTSLVVADDQKDEIKNKVSISSVGSKERSRLRRMTITVKKVYEKALSLDADLFHLHDPELIQAGLKLKRNGKKVIFDAHEDLPKQILSKSYLHPLVRKPLSTAFSWYEQMVFRKFDAIVAATPYISKKITAINPNTIDINNYPLLDEFKIKTQPWASKNNEITYVGGITKIRGILELVRGLSHTKGLRLNLAGSFSEEEFRRQIKNEKNWEKINELGFIDRHEVSKVLAKSKLGLVTFLPEKNHTSSQPNKLFEYMAAGLPVVASNFPLWQEIINGNACGVCVNPLDPQAVGKAIMEITSNDDLAEKMGQKGKLAVQKKYNWQMEEQKLIKLYENTLSK